VTAVAPAVDHVRVTSWTLLSGQVTVADPARNDVIVTGGGAARVVEGAGARVVAEPGRVVSPPDVDGAGVVTTSVVSRTVEVGAVVGGGVVEGPIVADELTDAPQALASTNGTKTAAASTAHERPGRRPRRRQPPTADSSPAGSTAMIDDRSDDRR
jgi:hypothetical protein